MNVYLYESWLETIRLLRLAEASMPTVLLPLLFYWLTFGLFDGQGFEALVGVVIIASMAPGAFSGAIYVANERQSGWLAMRWQYGRLGWWLGKQTAMLTLSWLCTTLLVLLTLFTQSQGLDIWQCVQLYFVSLVTSLLFTNLGLAMGLRLSESGAIGAINLMFFPLVLASGIALPLSLLPDWVASLALWLPPKQLMALVQGGALMQFALVCSLVFSIALLVWSIKRCNY